MASHDLAVETLLINGLRHRKLDEVLASNCALDWFGRTFVGQPKVVDFYQNSHSTLEHSLKDVKSAEAFEDRPNHLLTRIQPTENSRNPPESSGDEQWFNCENPLINLREAQLTPIHKSSPSQCPPAPRRYMFEAVDSSDDELESDDDDDECLSESGIRPLDASLEIKNTKQKSPKSKKLRREEKLAPCTEAPSPPAESRFSELHYLEATGSVSINRQTNETEKRDCIVLISYRISKDDSSNIQIALIVYQNNSTNPKTRRNLMTEFQEKTSELDSPSTSTASRCRSTIKNKKGHDEVAIKTSTESTPSKAMKRPMSSKASLRF